MKILFVCRANVGRSQVAEAFYKSLVPTDLVASAGYAVNEKQGQPLHEFIIQSMGELGFDLSQKYRKQLTEHMIQDSDVIIALFPKSEAPQFLSISDKVSYWEIDDPAGKPIEFHKKMINEVREKILQYLNKDIQKV